MGTIQELTTYVSEKAILYLEETGETIGKFPSSIVDFVIEYATEQCHFPQSFTENQKIAVLEKHKNALAMACNDVYARAGAEGQTGHSENGISRSYDSAWISPKLLSGLPNYVEIF
jgi:hypothetical protein